MGVWSASGWTPSATLDAVGGGGEPSADHLAMGDTAAEHDIGQEVLLQSFLIKEPRRVSAQRFAFSFCLLSDGPGGSDACGIKLFQSDVVKGASEKIEHGCDRLKVVISQTADISADLKRLTGEPFVGCGGHELERVRDERGWPRLIESLQPEKVRTTPKSAG